MAIVSKALYNNVHPFDWHHLHQDFTRIDLNSVDLLCLESNWLHLSCRDFIWLAFTWRALYNNVHPLVLTSPWPDFTPLDLTLHVMETHDLQRKREITRRGQRPRPALMPFVSNTMYNNVHPLHLTSLGPGLYSNWLEFSWPALPWIQLTSLVWPWLHLPCTHLTCLVQQCTSTRPFQNTVHQCTSTQIDFT